MLALVSICFFGVGLLLFFVLVLLFEGLGWRRPETELSFYITFRTHIETIVENVVAIVIFQ